MTPTGQPVPTALARRRTPAIVDGASVAAAGLVQAALILAAVAGLRKEAMFVGRLNKFEIWEPGRFNENNKGNEAVAAAAIKNLNL